MNDARFIPARRSRRYAGRCHRPRPQLRCHELPKTDFDHYCPASSRSWPEFGRSRPQNGLPLGQLRPDLDQVAQFQPLFVRGAPMLTAALAERGQIQANRGKCRPTVATEVGRIWVTLGPRPAQIDHIGVIWPSGVWTSLRACLFSSRLTAHLTCTLNSRIPELHPPKFGWKHASIRDRVA